MTPGEVVIVAFMTFVSGGLGTLFWSRMNRFEEEMSGLREEMARLGANMATRADLEEKASRFEDRMGGLEAKMSGLATRAEMNEGFAKMSGLATRAEMNEGFAAVRGEIAGLRSDLTQVALAVGARRPRASEG